MKKLIVLASIFYAFSSLAQEAMLEGLWHVTSVSVGDQEMTPNAKWTRFNADGTQQSGNGWRQHSVGTWTFDNSSMELTIVTENGVADPFGPFNVDLLSKTQMEWIRQEEGSVVRVSLERVSQLPLTYGDQVLGLWELKEAVGDEALFANSTYLFVRWDGKFVIGTKEGKRYGVYNVHGHKAEIELIPYGEGSNRSFWQFEVLADQLTLRLLNSEQETTRSYHRINTFPE